ncbi:putative disease resistance protein RGA3 [Vicia villosa]|uniref:putative disease resistance protein RGA3 n=1 Tax=Vicia villosa TaxID=3911 RepID=UPI00273B25B1|nr:putative disease resistance protein RGA3 [Vicia villosa]
MVSLLFDLAETLIAKVASRACEEAFQVLCVYSDILRFTQTISYIKSVLMDAEQKPKNFEQENWLWQVANVLIDAENLLDEVEFQNLRKKAIKANVSMMITKVYLYHLFSCSNPIAFRFRVARKINEINRRLDNIAANRNKFGFQTIETHNDTRIAHRGEMTYSRVINSEVIGREHDKEKIVKLLAQHDNNDKNLSVIPIAGLGGVGKTTLAKFVFNDDKISECFSSKMWVCVSGSFDIKEVIIKIINSANDSAKVDVPAYQQNYRDLDIEQLQNHLTNKLNGQKFLLVLDDVWNEDRVQWTEVRDLLQVGALGSKILITTRSHSIASMMGTVSSHSLEGLSLEDSLSIFVKWAFKEGEAMRYPHLVNIGREIVKKCGGIPLAVRTVGSLLFSKYETAEYWENVRDNEIWNSPDTVGILPSLKLSYDQMPSALKKCFALFSIYPYGHAFDSFHVTSLWRALGYLPAPNRNQNQTLKYSANQYLFELLSISFLQDFVDYGIGFTFKMHDLVHDLAKYVARKDFVSANPYFKHWSWTENTGFQKNPFQNLKFAKSILFPIAEVGPNSKALLNRRISTCKHLRFFDLSYSTYETLPWAIGKLVLLRYLSLENNKKIKRLPDSICSLQSLEILILSGCTELETLPKGLENLINLQHLEITTKQHVLPEDEIANLRSLHTLRIEFCSNLESLFARIKLSTLKVLCIANCSALKSLPLDIEHFPALETLLVDNCDMLELSEGHEEQNSSLRLKVLVIVSMLQLVIFPHWLQGSLNTLQYLSISSCNNLVALPQWLSDMNSLKTLYIIGCPNIMSLPNDFHRLVNLERVEIDGHLELLIKPQLEIGESSRPHNAADEPDEVVEELE